MIAAVVTAVLTGAMAAAPVIGPTPAARAAAQVTVTTLSLPVGSDYGGRAVAINDNGQIAGWSSEVLYGRDVPFEFRNAEYWGPGGAQINLNPPLVLSSMATSLNRNGMVAGETNKDVVAWTDRVPAYLAPFACMGPSHCSLHTVAINDNDQVAVVRKIETYTPWHAEAAIWQNGKLSPWVDLGGNGEATAMNSAGTIVGSHYVGSPGAYKQKAFTLSGGTLTDLESPGWSAARALAINDNGLILGEVTNDYFGYPYAKIHAVVWQNGTMTDLGTLGGKSSTVRDAHSLNDRGQVVGGSDLADGGHHAFLWQNGQMTDLGVGSADPANAATPSDAWAVGENGQVIGKGDRGFFWQNGTVTWLPAKVQPYAINKYGEMAGEAYSPALNNHFGGIAPARIIVTP